MIKKTKSKKTLQKDVFTASKHSFGYSGQVTVSIMNGNKVVSTTKYHNHGMPNLFKFLCATLSGNYSESLRPCKIQLYKYTSADLDDYKNPQDFDWDSAWTDPAQKPEIVTPFVSYDITPVVKKVLDNNGKLAGYSTTFHFRIPYSYIISSFDGTIIHLMGIYPNNVTAEEVRTEVSAYYLLVDDDNPTQWKPIEIDSTVGNFSLVIDWKMEITNKQ